MSKIKAGLPIKYNEHSIFAKWQMKIIKKKALDFSQKTGRVNYIIPSGENAVVIIDNKWRKHFNKHSKIKLTFKELIETAYFVTPKVGRVL